MLASKFEAATCCRNELRDVKYIADPRPVLRADGAVPRHSPRNEDGPDMTVAIVLRSD